VRETVTFAESRCLPALIAAALVVMGVLIILLSTLWYSRLVGMLALLGAIWPLMRSLKPRWILKLEGDRVLFNDLPFKRVTEIHLTHVRAVRIADLTVQGSGADGGIGFQKALVLEGSGRTWSLPLPAMQTEADDVAAEVHRRLRHLQR